MSEFEERTLFLTVGLPGSGKTYFADRLAKDLGIFHLNCDRLRMVMFEHPEFTPDEHKKVFATADEIITQHLQLGLSAIYGANFNQPEHRRRCAEIAQAFGARAITLYIKTPFEIALQRANERDHEIPPDKQRISPEELLNIMQRTIQPPGAPEPFIKIDGTLSYLEQRVQFDEQFRQLHN